VTLRGLRICGPARAATPPASTYICVRAGAKRPASTPATGGSGLISLDPIPDAEHPEYGSSSEPTWPVRPGPAARCTRRPFEVAAMHQLTRPARSLLGLLIIAALAIAPAHADTLHVPGDYATIQAAIDAAVDGDIVEIADGTYTGRATRTLTSADAPSPSGAPPAIRPSASSTANRTVAASTSTQPKDRTRSSRD
jgi:hypothetical protein